MRKIRSDDIQAHQRHTDEIMSFMDEPVPVDMYGARVFRGKEEGALEKAAQDIKDRFGLNTEGF